MNYFLTLKAQNPKYINLYKNTKIVSLDRYLRHDVRIYEDIGLKDSDLI